MFPFGVALSYREEVVMKKLFIACISLCSILFFACNFGIKKDFATVEIYFGDSSSFARAVDPVTSLPELSRAYIKIEVEGKLSGYSVKELKPEDPKNISLNLPIGDTVRIKVSVSNPSGIWSGAVTHTVDPESNVVGIKLKKNVSGLNNLLFTQTEDGQHGYNLTLYMGGKKITVHPSHRRYSFERDSKGRLYVGYESGTAELVRYTSEGNNSEAINLSTPAIAPNLLMNDFTKGVSYVVDNNRKVYKIEENSVNTTGLATLDFYQGAAAIDDNRVVWAWKDNPFDPLKLYVKNNLESSGENPIRIDIAEHIGMHDCVPYRIPDIFIRGGYVYVLFTTVNASVGSSGPNLYSLGGVVRYKINDLDEDPVKIGFDDDPDFDDGVLEDYDYSKNFYGAVKVIGFDDENIYIADDGFDAAYVAQAESPRIVKNRNRIAALNIATNTVSFTEEYTAKWYNEWKEWRTPDTKTVVWKKNNGGHGFDYYQISSANDLLPGAAFGVGDGQPGAGSDHYFTDVFCYDQDGNLYIVRKKHGSHCISRFELKDDGSYDQEPSIMTNNLSGFPTAIAVDISGSVRKHDNPVNALYYSYDASDKSCIERLTWEGDEFSAAALDNEAFTLGTFAGPLDTQPPLQTKTRFTALAANKDGFFVGVGTTFKNTTNNGYTIKVKKYAHTARAYNNPVGSIDISEGNLPAPNSHTSQSEDITALYIQDGVLYALLKQEKRKSNDIGDKTILFAQSGRLFRVGSTENFSGNSLQLFGENSVTDTSTGDFVPYRFIAVKPKKITVASDGGYGKLNTNQPENKNKIWTFTLTGSNRYTESSDNAPPSINFSHELKYDGCGFGW